MGDSTTARTRMTRDIYAGSASSGSPLAPPKASPCVLDRLDLARPRAHAAAGSTISEDPRLHRALADLPAAMHECRVERHREVAGRVERDQPDLLDAFERARAGVGERKAGVADESRDLVCGAAADQRFAVAGPRDGDVPVG